MGFSSIVQPSNVTYPGQGGQPAYGQPSQVNQQYTNTVGPWDNASIVQQPATGKGGGKGQQQWQPFKPTWTPGQGITGTGTSSQSTSGTSQSTSGKGNSLPQR